jgi:excinuclease ABC subunit C
MERGLKVLLPKDISLLPNTPGVYFFFGKKEILYIGKASNLKERVKNHFQNPSYKDHLFLSDVKKIGYLPFSSEIEALIQEARLIKKYQPKFNVLFRDDKNYFYLGITKEDFPRVFWTHQTKLKSQKSKVKTEFIGPFTDGKSLKESLKILRKIFPFRSCKKLPKNPCLYFHLNLCPGICLLLKEKERYPELKNELEREKENYQKQIQYLKETFEGKRQDVIKKLKKEMEEFAKKEEFEKAQKIKEKIEKLQNVFAHRFFWQDELPKENLGKLLKETFLLKKEPQRIEGYDISNLGDKGIVGSLVVFLPNSDFSDYQMAKEWYRKFKIKTLKKQADVWALKEVFQRRIKHKEWPMPDLIFVDGGKAQLKAAKEAFEKEKNMPFFVSLAKRGRKIYTFPPLKTFPLDKFPETLKMFFLKIAKEAHRFAIKYHKLLRKKSYFNL